MVARAMDAGERLCRRAVELGGTITGEHGVGALKQPWAAAQLGPAAAYSRVGGGVPG